eukprot:764322-Hanusia_phi.AAC.2
MGGIEEILFRDLQHHSTASSHSSGETTADASTDLMGCKNIEHLKHKITLARRCLLEERVRDLPSAAQEARCCMILTSAQADSPVNDLSSLTFHHNHTRSQLDKSRPDEDVLADVSRYFRAMINDDNTTRREELHNMLHVAAQGAVMSASRYLDASTAQRMFDFRAMAIREEIRRVQSCEQQDDKLRSNSTSCRPLKGLESS